jgi:cytochrome c biogenesis protein CcmG, thiol:disulfide interchange protein DsbE
MKRLVFILPVIGFIALIGFFAIGLTKDPKELPSQLIDRPLPAFSLPGIEAVAGGGPGLASTALTGEPSLLNVFGSWCAACPQEHPVLTRISKAGVPVYGIAWKDKPEDTRGWIARFGNPYRAIAADESGRTAIDLGVTGAPESFIVDARGRVRYKVIGPISNEKWDSELRPLMDKLRAEA